MMANLVYTGKKLNEYPIVISRNGEPDETIFPYLPDDELIKAVNLALVLKRPLLVMGEPGCGKSRLAQAIAYELYHQTGSDGQVLLDYKLFYQEWFIKSTSKAQEGLYEYDAIRRLADAQIARTSAERDSMLNTKYWELGPMGKAFANSVSDDRRVVLLIDEIDKADIDFPNDLLNELDKAEFYISETRESFKARKPPIVIITSNGEKDLPDAFLRRCLYHYIQPFDADFLQKIIVSRFHPLGQSDAVADPDTSQYIEKVTQAFLTIRREIDDNKLTVGGKSISTSEFLDWYGALHYCRTQLQIKQFGSPAAQEALQLLTDELQQLDQVPKKIPFRQVLFKNYNTLLNFGKNQVP